MSRKDIRASVFLATSIFLLVVSLTTGFLDRIIVPVGLSVFGILIFGSVLASMFHFRKYKRDHPFIPYAGQWSHILCKKCEESGAEYSIELNTGSAFEGWTKTGKYYRQFKRRYIASCSNGHSWIFDPIMQRNEWKPGPKKPVYKRNTKRVIEKSRQMRALIHRFFAESEAK